MRSRNSFGRFIQEPYIKVVQCERCEKTFRKTKNHTRFCSKECYKANRKYIDPLGYICIKLPEHPHATTNGWVREHIVVACNKIGRMLERNECVHHVDGDKTNNLPDNLEVMPTPVHLRKHFGKIGNRQYGEKNPKIKCACGCGKSIFKYDTRGRPRKSIWGHYLGKSL